MSSLFDNAFSRGGRVFHTAISAARRATLTACCVLTTACCLVLTAQAQTAEPFETLRIETDLVNLNASVFNRDFSKPTASLSQKEFSVFENGEPQEILFFASNETPFDLVLLLDLSGSTADRIDVIRKSAKRFVDASRPADRIAIVTFTAEIQVVSRFSADHAALKKAIDDMKKPSGGTNFWDALRFVLDHLVGQSRTDGRRSAVVVMTDGVDNALPELLGEGSTTTFEELIEVVRRSDSIVLPIYLDTEKEAGRNPAMTTAYELARKQLADLASEGGGNVVYQARKVKDLNGVYEQVIRDLSTVYSIGYRPANRTRDGAWRSVSVRLPAHPELVVRSKHGYYSK